MLVFRSSNSSKIIWTKAYSNHKFCLELFMCVMMSWPKLYYYFWLEGRCYEFLYGYTWLTWEFIYFWFEVYWQMTRYMLNIMDFFTNSDLLEVMCVVEKIFLLNFLERSERNERSFLNMTRQQIVVTALHPNYAKYQITFFGKFVCIN